MWLLRLIAQVEVAEYIDHNFTDEDASLNLTLVEKNVSVYNDTCTKHM